MACLTPVNQGATVLDHHRHQMTNLGRGVETPVAHNEGSEVTTAQPYWIKPGLRSMLTIVMALEARSRVEVPLRQVSIFRNLQTPCLSN